MNFLKSYRGARLVMVVVIVLCVLLGFHRSLTAEREKVEALFYDGADGSGYSIATDLEDRRTTALNLLSVAERYLDEDERSDLSAAVRELGEAETLGEKYDWNETLGETAEQLMLKLDACSLSEKDAEYVRGFRTDLAARADTIARDPYNEQAEAFNKDVLGSFPASLLRRITFVDEVPVFG